jgi:hypothetical protein
MIGPAVREARRLGHRWLVPEHLLLAVARGSSPAGEALREGGVGPEAVEARLELMHEDSSPEHRGVLSTPAWHEVNGFARGFAAAQGRELEPADGVVAFFWTQTIWPFPGADREQVIDRLGAHGVRLPNTPPPDLDTRRWGPDVRFPVEDLDVVLRELPRLLPDPTAIGFNSRGDTAWIRTLAGVDLPPLVERVLSEAR